MVAEYVFQANIAHYEELLASEPDVQRSAALRELLAEEQAKLLEWRAKQSRPAAE